LAVVATVAIFSALVLGGCGDGGDDGTNPTGPIDNNYIYSGDIVDIGGKKWMSKNLDRATANSWCYENNNSNCEEYGRLYTWGAAMTACPSPWRLPTNDEWQALVDATGDLETAGTALKASSPNWNGTDAYEFSALPGGGRLADGSFEFLGESGYWWTSTKYDVDGACIWSMFTGYLGVDNDCEGGIKDYGFSVRCVQD
jgi:uncharacterized protein (TIGR02145 family)